MKFYADLHIHSHYSRATAKNLDLEHLYLWAQLKGIHLVGTGDCVHPAWLKECEHKLEAAEEGFFKLKDQYAKPMDQYVPARCRMPVRFMLTVEISNIYKRLDRVRKVHNLIWVPSFTSAKKIQKKLNAIGNITSDGRPILGLDSRDLLEITLEADPMNLFVPAHIWTPWFSVLGSMGGFDKISDCFADLTGHIHAVETGLSSDPSMNWRLKQLDDFILVSNSDAHSPSKLGREANVFDTDFSYPGIYDTLVHRKNKGLVSTLEFFPEEGKYHYDGHRSCDVRLDPLETIKLNGKCPQCKKAVIVGVMSRVQVLADRPVGKASPRARDFKHIISLPEIVAQVKEVGSSSKTVNRIYHQMLEKLGSEFTILLETSIDDIQQCAGVFISQGVARMREGRVFIDAGYDGKFGTITLFNSKEREAYAQPVR